MSLNFKNTTLFIIVMCGFLFFLVNAIELSLNYKNILTPKSVQSPKSVSNFKDIPNKPQVEADDLINKFTKNENKTENKETIIIVKKVRLFYQY